MRLLVCGGRDFTDRACVWRVLDHLHAKHRLSCIIHGDQRGADHLGRDWAVEHGVQAIAFPADWKTLKRAAGPIRNRQMLDEGKPDAVVAFLGGVGTADMIRAAGEAGITVYAQP